MFIIDLNKFLPNDILMKDDALHRKGSFGRIETWYYDAIFNDNYSVVSLVNVFHLSYLSFVITSFFIYHNTNLVKFKRKIVSYKRFYGSEKELLIKINDRQIIKGYRDKNSNKCIYNISRGNHNYGFDLEFIKTMKAWKGKTYLGDWLVIPRFKVNGTLYIDGDGIKVSGEGYHDHNIYPFYVPLINKGYHFGKIPIDSMNITWAHVMKNRNKEQVIVVLNKDKKFISIKPNNIQFIVETFSRNHGIEIPEKCCLKIKNDLMNINIKMEPLNIDYTKIPAVNYWRYHIRCYGNVEFDSFSKKIDTLEISEYLKFL